MDLCIKTEIKIGLIKVAKRGYQAGLNLHFKWFGPQQTLRCYENVAFLALPL